VYVCVCGGGKSAGGRLFGSKGKGSVASDCESTSAATVIQHAPNSTNTRLLPSFVTGTSAWLALRARCSACCTLSSVRQSCWTATTYPSWVRHRRLWMERTGARMGGDKDRGMRAATTPPLPNPPTPTPLQKSLQTPLGFLMTPTTRLTATSSGRTFGWWWTRGIWCLTLWDWTTTKLRWVGRGGGVGRWGGFWPVGLGWWCGWLRGGWCWCLPGGLALLACLCDCGRDCCAVAVTQPTEPDTTTPTPPHHPTPPPPVNVSRTPSQAARGG